MAAQGNLGLMYDDGKGILQDTITAHMWFNIASAKGNTDAAKKMAEQELTKRGHTRLALSWHAEDDPSVEEGVA